jgi:hypothetical protein
VRIEERSTVKALCMGNECGKRRERRHMRRWFHNVENGLKSYGHQIIEVEGYQMEWAVKVREQCAVTTLSQGGNYGPVRTRQWDWNLRGQFLGPRLTILGVLFHLVAKA